MDKSQIREIGKLAQAHKLGMTDYVARGLSALIRSAMRESQRKELMQYADIFRVRNHAEFII